jgi:hypothetical protein
MDFEPRTGTASPSRSVAATARAAAKPAVVSKGQKVRLQGSPRERPECAPKRPFLNFPRDSGSALPIDLRGQSRIRVSLEVSLDRQRRFEEVSMPFMFRTGRALSALGWPACATGFVAALVALSIAAQPAAAAEATPSETLIGQHIQALVPSLGDYISVNMKSFRAAWLKAQSVGGWPHATESVPFSAPSPGRRSLRELDAVSCPDRPKGGKCRKAESGRARMGADNQ